ncbi:MAG: thioredoxin-dependent thiol peroxidase [Nanoarchaeota archaeon]|nr:thioredoxin-dependent thiol peroxidase [Nanoarchaeota archaeon]
MVLEANTKAPQFTAKALVNGREAEISLEDYKGHQVVLYFYPKDMTPGCTTQAENLRDNFTEFQRRGIIVLGVSPDSIKKHQNFQEKKELPFTLIYDEEKELANLYDVWQLKKFMGKEYMGIVRTTYLIDKDGVISHVITKPKVKEHSEEILALLE